MDTSGNPAMGVFDLNVAVLPGERLPLHVFETRYKQLVNDCFEKHTEFCILFCGGGGVILGSTVKVSTIDERFPDGRMDITVEGTGLIKVIRFLGTANGKLYTEVIAERQFLDCEAPPSMLLEQEFMMYCDGLGVRELFDDTAVLNLYEIADNIGLEDREKKQLLKNRDFPDLRENVVFNHLRLLEAVRKQEEAMVKGLILN